MALRQSVYQQIKEDIIFGRLPAGTPLRESELARRFGVSRTPVREALGRLIAEGFVTASSGTVATVAGLSVDDINELFDLRLCYEKFAVEEYFARGCRADLTPLREQQEAYVKAWARQDFEEFFLCNVRFHECLVGLIGNKRLLAMSAVIRDQMVRTGFIVLHRGPAAISDAIAEHESILRSLERRDREACLQAIRYHVEQAKKRLYES